MVLSKSQRFKKVYIEITNVCNLSCPFCPGTTRAPAFMNVSDFEKVLRNLSGYTQYIYLHVMGEPLLHPDLRKLLEISASYGFRVNITTNGTLISQKQQDLLDAGALRQVNFSLHSQESVVAPDKLEKYEENIFEFTGKALDRGDIYISYRLWNVGSPSAEQFNKHVLQRIEKFFMLDFSLWDAFVGNSRLTIKDRLYLNRAEVFQWPDEINAGNDKEAGKAANTDACGESAAKGFCLGLRDQMAILADGTVVPCCLDNNGTINLGNILSQDIDSILKSERAEAFYRGFSERRAVERLCRNCTYRERFS